MHSTASTTLPSPPSAPNIAGKKPEEEAARVVFTGYLTQKAECVLRKPMSCAGQSGKDNTCKCPHTRSIVTCLLFPHGAARGSALKLMTVAVRLSVALRSPHNQGILSA